MGTPQALYKVLQVYQGPHPIDMELTDASALNNLQLNKMSRAPSLLAKVGKWQLVCKLALAVMKEEGRSAREPRCARCVLMRNRCPPCLNQPEKNKQMVYRK